MILSNRKLKSNNKIKASIIKKIILKIFTIVKENNTINHKKEEVVCPK